MTKRHDPHPVPEQTPAATSAVGEVQLRRLIRLMLANLGAGLVAAAMILIFHDQIVAHQLAAAHPAPGTAAQTRNSLSITLWTRPAPAVGVALLYPLFIRRLHQHQRRGYRRVLIVAVAQLAGLIWYAAGASYPRWLHAVQVAQALIVLAVLWTATRPALRARFGYPPPDQRTRSARRAAATLVVIAPLVAELTWGSTRASQIAGLLLEWPAYGAGALAIRELARRSGRGWPAILVLGVAYGLIEEGLGLQSLTSRTLYPEMAGLGPRLAGINTAYTLMVLTYHVVFSIGIPIALAEITHPGVRTTPWLRTPGLVVTAVVALLGFALIRLVPLTADPHYLMPWPYDIVFGVLVLALALLTLRGLRPSRPAAYHPGVTVPPPLAVAVVAFLATVAFLGLLMPLPGARYAGYAATPGLTWLPIAAAVVIGLATVVLAVRWTRAPGWRDRHTAAALTAALLGHTVIGLLSLAHTPLDRVALAVFGVAELALMIRLVQVIATRETARHSLRPLIGRQ